MLAAVKHRQSSGLNPMKTLVLVSHAGQPEREDGEASAPQGHSGTQAPGDRRVFPESSPSALSDGGEGSG